MRPSLSHYDTIIVGARPAGAATAMLLARAGQRVLVIDRATPGDDALSTHALSRPGVVLLHAWGALDRIAAVTPAVRATTFHYDDVTIPVAIKPRDGIDALYAPRRTVLDPILVALAREAGAEVHHRAKLVDLVYDERGAVDGVVVSMASRYVTITADLVVGADGLGSTVARLVGAPLTRSAPHATTTIYAHVPATVDGYHWYFRPGLSAGIVATNGGACVFLVTPPARYHTELKHDLADAFPRVLAEVASTAADLVAGAPKPFLRPFAGRTGYLRRASGRGWALVGDAGFFRDPLTAHGITDALRDAGLLARSIVGGDLESYEPARDELAVPILELTDAIASLAWTIDELMELHRRMQLVLARELDLACQLAARTMMPVAAPDPFGAGACSTR